MIKNYTLLIMLFFLSYSMDSFGQGSNDYDKLWKKVEDAMNKGLTKSAIDEVTNIYNLAKKDKNDAQIIKSLVYQVNLRQNIEEDAPATSIKSVEKEIKEAKQPARSILQSILAEMYWFHFQRNRYKLYDRTRTVNFVKDDIETWGMEDFHRKIGELYLQSLSEEKLLQSTKLEPFEAIITKGNSRYLRPTLYDLLVHRSLTYFKNDERDLAKPAYAFEIKDLQAFAAAPQFVSHKFINRDSSSLHYQALLIFQELLSFHAADAKPDAFIEADIERLDFVKQYGVMENKDELYKSALLAIAVKYASSPASAQANFLAAQMIYSKASQANKPPDSYRDDKPSGYTIKEAKNMLDAIVKKFPQSEGGINAQNLLKQILRKDLLLTTEKVNLPTDPFRTLVSYRNFSKVYFRIIPLNNQLKKQLQEIRDNEQIWSILTRAKYSNNWDESLPEVNDYKTHSVEIKVDRQPVGQYVLLASAAPDFNLSRNPLSAQYYYVSNISFINSANEYFILDRESGNPLPGAKVQVWTQRYDYTVNKSILEKQELLTADKNGYLQIREKKNENRSIRLEISYQKDYLFLDDYQYNYTYYNDGEEGFDVNSSADAIRYEKEKARIFLFTDRSIYRPGQLAYFKGIGVTKDLKSKKSKLLGSKGDLFVELYDANYQKVDSLKVSFNEFGSFNGKFRLPEDRLNGNFILRVSGYNDQASFSVEEYKRPKFYTEFEKVKGTYRVNDKIKVTGFAKAYAGNNIDGASVKYRVVRTARFLYPWMWWRWGIPRTQPMEITNGEIKTGADGKFNIEFEAIPDLSIDKSTSPVFDYRVEADVTDLNGETRSGSIIVPVGYKALDLQIILPKGDNLNVDSLKALSVSTKNLSGEFESTQVSITIHKLQTPDRLIRERYWAQPDQFLMSKEEFLKNFPNDEYKDENKKETWAKGQLMLSKSEKTTPTYNLQLTTYNFSQGWYVVEATAKDKYGQEVKDIKYFQLYDMKTPGLPSPSYSWNAVVKNKLEPGETAQFVYGSTANDIHLIRKTDKTGIKPSSEAISYQYFTLNNEKKTADFAVTEADRGGFGVYQFFVKDNRFYTTSWNVSVPWTNKDLNISFDTYRDKTLPGSEEKWKVKITGYKGEKVATEMLASMYDASLDQFKPHGWSALNVWPYYSGYNNWSGTQNFTALQSVQRWWIEENVPQKTKTFDVLLSTGNYRQYFMRDHMPMESPSPGKPGDLQAVVVKGVAEMKQDAKEKDNNQAQNQPDKQPEAIDQSTVQIRKNFNETAFFFPELRTDKDGNIEFSFTMPEALTQWKLMALAHTKDLASGYATKNVITQKELMVQPNPPRFLREGDKMEFTVKVVNLSDKETSGQAELHLLNATTMNSVDNWFKNTSRVKNFTAAAGQSTVVSFSLDIPYNYANALVYRIVAKAGQNSDGEEAAIPVLTNRMLVTETMPLPVRGNATKNFTFTKLLNSGSSSTLAQHALTVEYTTNPAWYVVQALPYLMEYPYECSEQTWNRYYANSLASKIANSSPKIKAVFEKWKITDTSALMSNLEKNQELKSVLLQETPWVLDAQNEAQQKKNIGLLFDMIRMSRELESSLKKLKDMQTSNGGFVWFKGGQDDRYITQYIVTGIGHLKKLNAYFEQQAPQLKAILNTAIPYLDRKIKEDYDYLVQHKVDLKQNNLGYIAIQYLYMHSFFPEYPVAKASETAYNYYREQAKKYWLSNGKYAQAMIALALSRTGDNVTAKAITRSLKENAIVNEELGMYWKEWNNPGYYWFQAPIESQAMMIEAFTDVDKDTKVVDDLKTWLLKNKQTTNWKTTKATAEACYAMLLQGTDWLSEEKNVVIKLGSYIFDSKNEKQEAGTGYFKRKLDGSAVKPEMGNISVTVSDAPGSKPSSNSLPSWGAVYWQYFEDLDKITFAETPLKLKKQLFIEKNTDRGPVLTPISDGAQLKVGDKIKVRIELRVDREMEYVHMKDMRAACMEPVNVISQYKYQGGLGYYESTKDASTNFFFGWLSKGTYVFEYPMFVTHNGNYSNGITSIQCMYAPEFTAHSEGIRVTVK